MIAAGNQLTAKAGHVIYEAGGNAVDAAVAACFMSFLSEPTLTSAAGGGFNVGRWTIYRRNIN